MARAAPCSWENPSRLSLAEALRRGAQNSQTLWERITPEEARVGVDGPLPSAHRIDPLVGRDQGDADRQARGQFAVRKPQRLMHGCPDLVADGNSPH